MNEASVRFSVCWNEKDTAIRLNNNLVEGEKSNEIRSESGVYITRNPHLVICRMKAPETDHLQIAIRVVDICSFTEPNYYTFGFPYSSLLWAEFPVIISKSMSVVHSAGLIRRKSSPEPDFQPLF